MFPAEAAWVSEPCKQKAVQSSEREGDRVDWGWEGGGVLWGGGSMWRVSPHCETVASEERVFMV